LTISAQIAHNLHRSSPAKYLKGLPSRRSRLLRTLAVCAAIPVAGLLTFAVLHAGSIPTGSPAIQNFDAIGAEVWRDLRDYGLDWLDYRSDLKRTLECKRYAAPEGNGTCSMQELVSADAQVVFKVLLGRKASAVADLKRFARNGFAEDALKLARKLRLSTRAIARTRGESTAT
jgi:hypothetical protein